MESISHVLLYITCRDREEALRIGRQLVADRLVACANVIESMTSVYEWQGQTCEDRECVLILKTRAALEAAARERALALHSYELPCVLSLPVASGHAPYLAWIDRQTGLN